MKASEQELKWITQYFLMPDILGYWQDIKRRYETMGFADKLSDRERIDEYDYITQQMNKYISRHQDQVLADADLERMLAEVSDMHAHAPFEGRERKMLVYFSMRDDWLRQLINLIGALIEQNDGKDDDEWI